MISAPVRWKVDPLRTCLPNEACSWRARLNAALCGSTLQWALAALLGISGGCALAGPKPGTVPPLELVGHWRGQARIVNNWTSVQSLTFNLSILADGSVTGEVGIAHVAGGTFEHFTNKQRAPYVLALNLDGAILEDGVIRRAFRLNLRREGDRLTGFGASDGGKMFPGASRQSMRRSMRLQVTSISLTKIDTPAGPSN